LTGLTRVRKFHQDDGHIFCTPHQIYDEINASLELVKQVYQQLGFPTYKLTLSTRPNKYLGDLNDWENAEAALTRALNDSKKDWTMKHGDGAFYGPKIDIMVKDSLGREHQTATIQLDFQLPKRFDLSYRDEKDEKARPVIIHRAILGSLERMLAILIENYNGKFPFWLSPRQILVVTTKTTFTAYSKIIKTTLESKGYNVELDVTDKSLGKKIQEASPYGFNYILIVGDKEFEAQTVTVRSREGIDMGEYSLEKLCEHFKEKLKNESLSL
jgi:threonyl-tRNA synthetase